MLGSLGLWWADGVLHVGGEMDVSNAHQLVDEVEHADPWAGDLVLDLTRLEFIDTEGCRAIIAALRQAQANDAHLVLRDPSRPVGRVLDILRLGDAGIEIRRSG